MYPPPFRNKKIPFLVISPWGEDDGDGESDEIKLLLFFSVWLKFLRFFLSRLALEIFSRYSPCQVPSLAGHIVDIHLDMELMASATTIVKSGGGKKKRKYLVDLYGHKYMNG
jgi:hypothetical protein